MRILIIGAGIVGYTLAEQLSSENHDIYVIEKDPKLIKEMNDNLDVFAVEGSGTSQNTLEAIGIQDMDLMVAVTNLDEINIVSCLMGMQYKVKKMVARVKSPELSNPHSVLNQDNCGINRFINPTTIVVNMIDQLVEVPGCTDVVHLGKGESQIRGFELPEGSSLVGRTVREIRSELAADAFTIIAVTKEGKTIIPEKDTLLQAGDNILVLLPTESLPMFLPLLKRRVGEVKKVVLFGASQAAIELAKTIENKYEQVILLEQNKERCEEVNRQLQKTTVINGSSLEKGTLHEIVIETVDVFICLSEDDEDNFMAAMMARQYGARRTIVLTEKPAYLEILEKTDIDIVINPRLITVGKILQFLRRGRILSAAKLREGNAEVLEYFIGDDSPVVGKTLRRLREKKLLPKGARVAAIIENGVVTVPDGDTVIIPKTTMVLFVFPEALEKVQDLFSGKKWKFF